MVPIIEEQKKKFLEAYDQFSSDIYRYISYKVSHKEITEDLVSQVFLKAWESILKNPLEVKNIRAFFYKIAHNLVIDHYRQKKKNTFELTEEIATTKIDHKNDHLEKLIIKDDIDQLKNILNKLNPEHKEIIELRFLAEMSLPEIAKITGKTKTNIYVIIHRSLKQLKQLSEPTKTKI